MEVADVVELALKQFNPTIRTHKLHISDGGEGFALAVTKAMKGKWVEVVCHDALMRPLRTHFGILEDNSAVMDVASTIGLTLLKPSELDPWNATSYGVGEMIQQILHKGIRKIIIGLGGSATNDCGRGMIEALEGADGLETCEFVIASDVTNPLSGSKGATYAYARQKGANETLLPLLEARNLIYGKYLEQLSHTNIINHPGAGAAGGLGAALLTMPRHQWVNGIELLLQLYGFTELLQTASLVITGEGQIDSQTLQGKAPYGIAIKAQGEHVPCIAICGKLCPDFDLSHSPWNKIIQVTPPDQSLAQAMQPETARENIMRNLGKIGNLYNI